MSPFKLPHFSGWRKLEPNEILKATDKFVRVDGTPGIRSITPEKGESAGPAAGETMAAIYDGNKRWYSGNIFPYWVYRKCSDPSIQRRLVGSKVFSNPLPLP